MKTTILVPIRATSHEVPWKILVLRTLGSKRQEHWLVGALFRETLRASKTPRQAAPLQETSGAAASPQFPLILRRCKDGSRTCRPVWAISLSDRPRDSLEASRTASNVGGRDDRAINPGVEMSKYYGGRTPEREGGSPEPRPDESTEREESTEVRAILEEDLGLEVLSESGGEINVACPWCGDDKPNHFYVNAESGLWKCQKCGESGGMKALLVGLEELGHIEPGARRSAERRARRHLASRASTTVRNPRALKPGDHALLWYVVEHCHRRLSPEHKDEFSWLSDELIEAHRIGSVTHSLLEYLSDRGVDLERCVELGILRRSGGGYALNRRGAVTVPTCRAGRVVNIEFRMPPGSKARKLSLKGVPRALFNPSGARRGERVLLAEGATDSLALMGAGFPCVVGAPSAGTFKKEWASEFAGCKEVIVCFDNDEAGRKGARRVCRLLLNVGVTVRDVVLPDSLNGEPVNDLRDFLAAGGTAEALSKLADDAAPIVALSAAKATIPTRPKARAVVVTNQQLREAAIEASTALVEQQEELGLYAQDRQVVRAAQREDGLSIEALSRTRFLLVASGVIDWMAESHGKLHDTRPSGQLVGVVREAAAEALPQLEAIVSGPFYAPDGVLIDTPGYHPSERAILDLPTAWAAAPPQRPTTAEVRDARRLIIEDLLADFPFEAEADRAHAIAAFLLPFVRRMIEGPTPLHLFEAPEPGTGKTLLANLIGILAMGKEPESIPLQPREEEIHKLLGAELSLGRPIILLDNLDYDSRRGALRERIPRSSAHLIEVRHSEAWDVGHDPRSDLRAVDRDGEQPGVLQRAEAPVGLLPAGFRDGGAVAPLRLQAQGHQGLGPDQPTKAGEGAAHVDPGLDRRRETCVEGRCAWLDGALVRGHRRSPPGRRRSGLPAEG